MADTTTDIVSLPLAGYAFLKGQAHPFSQGVACLAGHVLTRVRFITPPPLAEGLARAASFITAQGRPLAALAACELRSPAQMSPSDFAAFNRHYVELLRANGFPSEAPFTMARSNVAPIHAAPSTNTLFAFTYAAAADKADAAARRDFLISGKAEIIDGPSRGIVAAGDASAAGTEKKASYVLEGLRARVQLLGCNWTDISGIQIYTARAVEPVLPLLHRLGLAPVGLTLHPAHPPVAPAELEIDLRSVGVERLL
ncbi:MAG TPA: hypothetical protein VGP48_05300 [Stellaceae bacterium]|jgi:hypothetical protein|nr:hypothetical protein [Stellaceae bacterium]